MSVVDDDGDVNQAFEIFPFAMWRGFLNQCRRVSRRIGSRISLDGSSNRDLLDRLATVTKFAVFVVIGVELFLIVRDIVQENVRDYQEAMGDEDAATGLRGLWSGDSGSVLSPANVRKLILWLEEPNKEKRDPPPSDVSPAWMIPVAEELRECKALSLAEIQRILLQLTRAEATLLQSCLLPSRNKINFCQVGGLVGVQATIARWLLSSSAAARETHSQNKLTPYHKFVAKVTNVRSLCLWGPPGNGKSFLIRAISNHSGLPTLVITPSLIQRKWYGETTGRVRTLFKLVDTLKKSCVVLDEIDGLFKSRNDNDHEVTRELKTEWLQWWDGVASASHGKIEGNVNEDERKVLFIAATNRPWDVDAAAWRRLGQRVYVGLPNQLDRQDLFNKWSSDLPISPEVLEHLVISTEGYTPSDLLNVLAWACQNGPIARNDMSLTSIDVQNALSEVAPTRLSHQYISQLQNFLTSHRQDVAPIAPSPHSSFPQSSHGDQSNIMVPNEQGYCWETSVGNFYQFLVPVDSSVFDAIQDIYWHNYNNRDEDFFSDSDYDNEDSDSDFDL
jgi:hypothetical protein